MAVLWEEIGWVDLETYLRRDDRALLPVGSCEQHGRHLSFATHYLIPTEIAKRVSARTGVPVAATRGVRRTIPKFERAAHSPWREGRGFKGPRHWKAFFPHGATGVDPKKGSPEIGERLLAAATDRFAREVEQWEPLERS